MPHDRHRLLLETVAPIDLIDITDRVRDWVRAHAIRDGLLTVTSLHTTARVNINESEAELHRDMVAFLGTLAPRGAGYGHDRAPVDGRGNAHAHLLGLCMSTTETIPVQDGDLVLGAWQRILFVELDGPRPAREVLLQLLGDARP
jgi:secondary thiamine-phosphate synthase enzyme